MLKCIAYKIIMSWRWQATISHTIFPFHATYYPFCLLAAMSHNRKVFQPQHLSISEVITLKNDKFRALKLQFLKSYNTRRKMIPLRNFRSLFKINELFVQFINCFTFYKEEFTSFYTLWAPRQIVWGSLKHKKKWEKSQY